MTRPRFARLRSFFSRAWRVLDASRRVAVNLLFLLIVVAFVAALLGGPGPLREKTALVLDLKGPLVEQRPGGLRDDFERQTFGGGNPTTSLRDVLTTLDAAAKDNKIDRVVLLLDEFSASGLPALREVASAIDRFKASGKQVVAWGASFDQAQYFVASHASEVYLHPMGLVFLKGMGRYRAYYKDALDRLGINVNVLRVGSYKNFGETYVANGPSKESVESETYLYNGLWSNYTDSVEQARKLPQGSIMRGIEALPQRLTALHGDAARLALDAKLVDGLKTRDELRALLIERGVKDEQSKTFRQISFADYLQRQKLPSTGDAVGVVVAEGEIVDGIAPPGQVGGVSTAELIRKARDDDKIKAIVLRVNSPGGSAFASELVRRELEVTRKAGKPVIVSMGSVAASGGYWISMAADEVIADPATVTGSIGVIALLPTADKAMDKLSLHTGGVTTTWLAGAEDPRRPLDPRFAQLVQSTIEHVYGEFTGRAAEARKTTPQKIDEVGQGRVWTGVQAKDRGLVDRLGSYGDALKAAAQRAKLTEGSYRVVYVEREPGKFERLMGLFGDTVAQAVDRRLARAALAVAGVPPVAARDAVHDLGWLAELTEGRRPFSVVTHCLCGATP
jgi:protease-4